MHDIIECASAFLIGIVSFTGGPLALGERIDVDVDPETREPTSGTNPGLIDEHQMRVVDGEGEWIIGGQRCPTKGTVVINQDGRYSLWLGIGTNPPQFYFWHLVQPNLN